MSAQELRLGRFVRKATLADAVACISQAQHQANLYRAEIRRAHDRFAAINEIFPRGTRVSLTDEAVRNHIRWRASRFGTVTGYGASLEHLRVRWDHTKFPTSISVRYVARVA